MKPMYLLLVMALMGFTAKGSKPNPDVLPSGQPVSERNAQNMLPMGGDSVWNTLLQSKISYSNVAPHITATLTPDIKKLDGKTLSADGFILPLDASSASKHFLLSKRTPTCPFCPPGEPNEVIEVFCAKPVKVDDALVSVRGKFALTNNTDNGIFFVMKEAEVSAPATSPSGQPAGSNKPTMY
ncbi:MAG TPA: DUF3299 domain-containing protein [Alphaproteobacteria bacterium]|nr:DUF3299 domain-containing protein [Alphaproteobacteria bacterium]